MKKAIRASLPVVVFVIGAMVTAALVKSKPVAEQVESNNRGTIVELLRVGEVSERVSVRARGTVMPARQVALGPEVGGRIAAVAEHLVPGGRFGAGEDMLRLDPSDYRLAVEQQFAMVDSAQTSLELEQSRKKIAEREWELFKDKQSGAGNPVALREPQLRSAKVNLQSAESGLKRAKLSVSRTMLRAPFNGMVQERSAEVGRMVAPATPLVTFVGTDAYWVQVSMPIERLAWIRVPGVSGETEGSPATIRHRVGDSIIERKGRVLRLLADVDAAGHMARVVVEIEDPLGLTAQTKPAEVAGERPADSSPLPLLLGSYVEVEIEGRSAQGVVELPRIALREDSKVYKMIDSKLVKVDVEVLWRQEDTVLISGGLKGGDEVIVSPLSTAVEGMKLRLPGAAETGQPVQQEKSAPPANGKTTEVAR